MKFTQRSLIFYFLGLSTVSKLVRFFFRGLGLMLYILKLLPLHPANPQWTSGCGALGHLGRGFEFYCLSHQFVFLSNWRELDFHERFHLEISSKCDIKAENSSTLCKFRKGRKWLQPMGSNPARFSRLVRQEWETKRKTLLAGCTRRRSHSQGRGTFKAERYLHFFRYTRDRAIDIPLFSQGPVSRKAVLCLPCLHSRSKFQLFWNWYYETIS